MTVIHSNKRCILHSKIPLLADLIGIVPVQFSPFSHFWLVFIVAFVEYFFGKLHVFDLTGYVRFKIKFFFFYLTTNFLQTIFALILSSYIDQAYFSSSIMKIESYGILHEAACSSSWFSLLWFIIYKYIYLRWLRLSKNVQWQIMIHLLFNTNIAWFNGPGFKMQDAVFEKMKNQVFIYLCRSRGIIM